MVYIVYPRVHGSSSEGESPRQEIPYEYISLPQINDFITWRVEVEGPETFKMSIKQPPGQIELDHYLVTLVSARENVNVLQYCHAK